MKHYLGMATIFAAAAAVAGDWQPLFDGKTLNGWEGATNGYQAVDGVLKCLKQGGGKLVTSKDYADFEMEFEFKLTPGANNGLGIRCKPAGDAAYEGMELQILDDDAPQYAKLHEYQYHGSIYGVVPAKRGHQKPVGEWNHLVLTCRGAKVTVEINGEEVTTADFDLWTKAGYRPDGTQHKFPESAYRDHPHKGYIGLQDHGGNCWYKNIKLRKVGG